MQDPPRFETAFHKSWKACKISHSSPFCFGQNMQIHKKYESVIALLVLQHTSHRMDKLRSFVFPSLVNEPEKN